MEGSLKAIRKYAFSKGLILGVILLLIDITALYAFALSQSVTLILIVYLLGFIVLPLAAVFVLIKQLRSKIGGFWNQREATSGIFIVFLVAYLISSLGKLFVFKFIPAQTKTQAIQNFSGGISQLLKSLSFDPDAIRKATKSIEQQFDTIDLSKLATLLPNLMFLIIILFVAAFIFGSLFKNSPSTAAKSSPNIN